MRYLFAIYVDEAAAAARSEAEAKAGVAMHAPYIEMLRKNGAYRGSQALGPSRAALTLRSAGGKPVATQGPYAECREHFGGFYVLEAEHLDAAIAMAAKNPAFQTVGVAIEIRPIPDGATIEVAAPPAGDTFVLALYRDPAHDDADDAKHFGAFADYARSAGRFVGGARLAPASSTTTVRIRDGKPLLVDGPFAETREQLAGYVIITARDRDDAVAFATPCVDGQHHALEVRAIRPTGVE
jgi:hypothetical protein